MTNTSCSYCLFAQSDPDYPLFRAQCRGCQVRSIAQCPAFWQAEKEGKLTPAYRQALERVFKGDWQTAHDDIKDEAQRVKSLRERNAK